MNGDVLDLPAPARRHRWSDAVVRRLLDETPDGNERSERTCLQCGLVKVTVHPPHGFPWRAWRTAAGGVWQGAATPPCLEARA